MIAEAAAGGAMPGQMPGQEVIFADFQDDEEDGEGQHDVHAPVLAAGQILDAQPQQEVGRDRREEENNEDDEIDEEEEDVAVGRIYVIKMRLPDEC